MNKKVVIGLLLLTSVTILAQEKKWSVEASYPISVGNSFFGDYNGIADLGIRYRAVDVSSFKLGASLNGSFFNFDTVIEEVQGVYSAKSNLIQPNLFSEFQIKSIPKLHPSLGLGYSFLRTNLKGTLIGAPSERTVTNSGLNFNLGVAYDVSKSIFVQARYDYTKLNVEGGTNGIHDDGGISLVKLGLGFRF